MSAGATLRPLVTSDSRFMPSSQFIFAALRASSSGTNSYSLIPVAWNRDWAHHLQSSEQCPDRALIIEQVSMVSPSQRSLTSFAASASSSVVHISLSLRASSTDAGIPSSAFAFISSSNVIIAKLIMAKLLNYFRGCLIINVNPWAVYL